MLFGHGQQVENVLALHSSLLGMPLSVQGGSGDAAEGRIACPRCGISFNSLLEHASRRPLYPTCKHLSPDMRGPALSCSKFKNTA